MALNPDSIPTSEQVRETLLDRFYYPYQRQIWAVTIVVAGAILAYLAVRQVRERRQAEQFDRFEAAQAVGRDASGMGDGAAERQGADERIQLLRRLVADFPDDAVTPFALNEIAKAQADAGRFDESLATLSDLGRRFPNYVLNTESGDTGPDGNPRSLLERMDAQVRAEKDWLTRTTYAHPTPSPHTLALVETTVGSFWLGLYEEQSPLHVANFVERAKKGDFNGTQVYDTRTGGTPESPTPMLFEAGSASSRPETWTAGSPGARNPADHDRDEPGATIEPEDSRFSIRHQRGVVSSALMASGESSQRFLVVCAPSGMDRYNGERTPFGMVIDREGSFATIDALSLSTTYDTHAETKNDPEKFMMRNHPYPPVWIRRVTVWRDEKLDAGHVWDTSLAGTGKSEPWEASLPKPPLPSEFAPKTPPVSPPTPPTPGDGGR